MIKDKLTVMVTIKDRVNTLPRAMNYYKDFPCDVIYLDSTAKKKSPRHKTQFHRRVGSDILYLLGPEDELPKTHEYRHTPNKNYCEKIYECCNAIKTKYSVIVCDDDFLSPTGLEECIDYLDQNPSCVSCRGQTASLNDSFIAVESLEYFLEIMFPFSSDCPKERVKYAWSHFNGASVHNIVRNDVQKNIFKFVLDNPQFNAIKFFDKIHSFMTAVQGDSAVLPIFFGLRSDESKTGHFVSNPKRKKLWNGHLNFKDDFLKVDLKPMQEILGVDEKFIEEIFHDLVDGGIMNDDIDRLFQFHLVPPQSKFSYSEYLNFAVLDKNGHKTGLTKKAYGCKFVLGVINGYEVILRMGVGGDLYGDNKGYEKWYDSKHKTKISDKIIINTLYPTISEKNLKQIYTIITFIKKFPL